jgi:Protein of unknown function (DUF3429)
MFRRVLQRGAAGAHRATSLSPPHPRHRSSASGQDATPPRLTLVLTGSGLAPFLWYGLQHDYIAAAGKPWGDEALARWTKLLGVNVEALFGCGDQKVVRARFLSYSACILSFVGAVHWGAALAARTPLSSTQFLFSVLPSLAGWGALSAPIETNAPYTVLALSHLCVYFFDEFAATRKPIPAVPSWYITLRAPVASTVVLLHCVAAFLSRDLRVQDIRERMEKEKEKKR